MVPRFVETPTSTSVFHHQILNNGYLVHKWWFTLYQFNPFIIFHNQYITQSIGKHRYVQPMFSTTSGRSSSRITRLELFGRLQHMTSLPAVGGECPKMQILMTSLHELIRFVSILGLKKKAGWKWRGSGQVAGKWSLLLPWNVVKKGTGFVGSHAEHHRFSLKMLR